MPNRVVRVSSIYPPSSNSPPCPFHFQCGSENDGGGTAARRFRPACAGRPPGKAGEDLDVVPPFAGACLKLFGALTLAPRQFRFDLGSPSTAVQSAVGFRSLCLRPMTFSARAFIPHLRGWDKSVHPPELATSRVFVQMFRQQFRKLWKNATLWRNGCCVPAKPTRIFEIEMDQAGHVVPAPEIQSPGI